MKFLIGLALILMGIFVEANTPNPYDDNDDDDGMSPCDEDEFHCPESTVRGRPWASVGYHSGCISSLQRCDTETDCQDGSDERSCVGFEDRISSPHYKNVSKTLQEYTKHYKMLEEKWLSPLKMDLRYWQAEVKNVEVGVRLIDQYGRTNKEYIGYTRNRKGPANVKYVKQREVRGRIEVFQDDGWKKLCIKGKTGDKGHEEKWRLASAACQMLGWEISGIPTATFDKRLEESGVSKYNYNCKKGDEKSIFECDREEKESECDADGKTDWATARCTKSLE